VNEKEYIVADEAMLGRLIDQLAAWVAEELRTTLRWQAQDTYTSFAHRSRRTSGRQLESPIELAFWLAWFTARYIWRTESDAEAFLARPQHEVEARGNHYRLDFAFIGDGVKVAVELDGHEFHERTPEQVEKRNGRDADLQSLGWTVIHFSGRQVLRNPEACAERVHGAICDSFTASNRAPRG
jgi:very-short-patch-repair endonuclease